MSLGNHSEGSPPPAGDIVGFVAFHLPAAIEFAERDIAATARARAYHIGQTIRRGSCPVRHPLDHPSCGYCVSAREEIARRAEAGVR